MKPLCGRCPESGNDDERRTSPRRLVHQPRPLPPPTPKSPPSLLELRRLPLSIRRPRDRTSGPINTLLSDPLEGGLSRSRPNIPASINWLCLSHIPHPTTRPEPAQAAEVRNRSARAPANHLTGLTRCRKPSWAVGPLQRSHGLARTSLTAAVTSLLPHSHLIASRLSGPDPH